MMKGSAARELSLPLDYLSSEEVVAIEDRQIPTLGPGLLGP